MTARLSSRSAPSSRQPTAATRTLRSPRRRTFSLRKRSSQGRTSNMRIGHGYDVHRLVSGRPCIIGGVNIPFELGLDGHSDADVLTHAVMDSLLGALALGDIGGHFPDTDPALQGRGQHRAAASRCRARARKRLAARQFGCDRARTRRPSSRRTFCRCARTLPPPSAARSSRFRSRRPPRRAGLYRFQTRHCRARRVPFRANPNSPIYYDNRGNTA